MFFDRSLVKAIVLLGLSVLAPACSDDCPEAHKMAEAIKEAGRADQIDTDAICSKSDEEITGMILDAPAVPSNEKESRADQYHEACRRYREAAEGCSDLGEDGDVG
jgi:hypothetical protein